MNLINKNIAKHRVLVFKIIQPILNLFYRKKALELLKKRSTLKLHEIEKLTMDIPTKYYFAATPEIEKLNDFYGIATVLKQYAKIPPESVIKSHIEHAISFCDHMYAGEVNCSYPSIILCGDYRAEAIAKSKLNRKVYKIGPYIKYAQSFLIGDLFEAEKSRLGRNALAFPTHSTPGIEAHYDIAVFCRRLREIKNKKKFKTIRVCLYWNDVKLAKEYQDNGIEVVTAGHMYDPLFLSRLRSLIELSDLTISNAVGTQLGYSICLEKPHFLIRQKIDRVDNIKELDEDFDENFEKSIKETAKVFEEYSEKITDKQRKVANSYAGFNHIKTPKELNQILRGVI